MLRCQSLLLPLSLLFAAHASAQTAAETSGRPHTVRVDCDRGQTLTRALERHDRSPLVLELSGTCIERVTITRDDLELRGRGENPTLEGSVTLFGVSRVALRGFRVRNTQGPDPFSELGDGVRVVQSQAVRLEGLVVEDTTRRGITLEQSSAELVDLLTQRNGGDGLGVITSDVNLVGLNTFRDSQTVGALASFGSMVFLRTGARVVTANSAFAGFSLQNNSTLSLSNQSELIAEGNASNGISVVQNSVVILGAGSIVSRNNVRGLALGELSNLTSFFGSNSSLILTGNSAGGLAVFAGASAQLVPGTRILGNGGIGLVLSNGTATLAGVEASGNATADVSFSFGARATFQGGNVFGTPVLCDATVLVRGAPGCQASPTAAALEASAEPTF